MHVLPIILIVESMQDELMNIFKFINQLFKMEMYFLQLKQQK